MAYKRISPQPVTEGGTGVKTVTGVLIGNGTSSISGNAVTRYYTLVGGASNAISSIAPSATSGIPLISNGSSANPSYSTAVVAGGGTGKTSFTTYAPICGGTTTTGTLQSATTGMSNSGYVLTSTGSSSLPTWQAASGGSGITTINGNSGSVTGSTITITGGSSGAKFSGSGTTLTESFNYLSLPATDGAGNGQISFGGTTTLQFFNNGTFVGLFAGNYTTGNQATGIGYYALNALTTGNNNCCIGTTAGLNLQSGNYNTAVGEYALTQSVSDGANTAIGAYSMQNFTGPQNTAVGSTALIAGSGQANTAIGQGCLSNATTSNYNTGLGQSVMNSLATGAYNLACGANGGVNYIGSESGNIVLNSPGVSSENNTLHIGSGTGTGNQQLNAAYISGIQGITVTGSAVLVSSTDQLGVAVSSRRFKDNIADMRDVSSPILDLRPVTFNYKVGDDKSGQTGLIAEEVAEIMPSLVVYDKEGLPQTVKYHELPSLLLNELQKAVRRIEYLEDKLSSYIGE